MTHLGKVVQDAVDEARDNFYIAKAADPDHSETEKRRQWYAAVVEAANLVLDAEWIGPTEAGCEWGDGYHLCGHSGMCAGEKSSAPHGCEFRSPGMNSNSPK
jgi:hypothetical protein